MKKYTKDMPRRLYTFFTSCDDGAAAPSFSKFARSIGSTLSEIESWRKNRTFDKAWRECIEIRRDYLTDMALTRRYDPSFVKFLLGAEFGVGESGGDGELDVSIKVIDNEA
jgi:hypothetical protein